MFSATSSAGRGSSENDTDYSLVVACFAGGVTAVCVLVVAITLTLYRRSHPMQPMKTQTHVVHCESREDRAIGPTLSGKDHRREFKNSRDFRDGREQVGKSSTRDSAKDSGADHHQQQQPHQQLQLQLQLQQNGDANDDNPDVIPNKVDRRAVIFEPNYTPKTERTKTEDFRESIENYEYHSPASVLHAKDTAWIYPDGYADRPEEMSPARPSTLPVHRTHDIYTRSSRVQESCI